MGKEMLAVPSCLIARMFTYCGFHRNPRARRTCDVTLMPSIAVPSPTAAPLALRDSILAFRFFTPPHIAFFSSGFNGRHDAVRSLTTLIRHVRYVSDSGWSGHCLKPSREVMFGRLWTSCLSIGYNNDSLQYVMWTHQFN